MSNEQLKRIFDNSACLTPRQMRHYVLGHMANEESHAVEVHLNSCPFCNEAIEGLFEQQEGSAVHKVTELNTDFLRDHFSLHNPQIHLNSMAPAQPMQHTHSRRRKKARSQHLWRPSSIAAAILLAFGMLWYLQFGKKILSDRQAAQPIASANVETPKNSDDNRSSISERPALMASAETVQPGGLQAQQPPVANGSNPQMPQPLLMAEKPEADDIKDVKPAEKKLDEVVVTQYKAPLIDAYSEGTRQKSAEQIEKMPARTTETVAATTGSAYQPANESAKISGARNDAGAHAIDGVRLREAAEDNMDKAEALYNQNKYSAALKIYKREMSADKRAHRQQAAVMAARCHVALGNKQTAVQILQSIVDEGGPQRRAARKLLRELKGAEAEE